ncbi:unnamed protein product [Lepidochelys kempii]
MGEKEQKRPDGRCLSFQPLSNSEVPIQIGESFLDVKHGWDPKQGSGPHCAVQTNNKDSVYHKELGVSQDPRDGHNGPNGWRCPDTEEMQRCGCSDVLKSCSTIHPSRAWKAHILLDKARQKFKEYFDPHKNDA